MMFLTKIYNKHNMQYVIYYSQHNVSDRHAGSIQEYVTSSYQSAEMTLVDHAREQAQKILWTILYQTKLCPNV